MKILSSTSFRRSAPMGSRSGSMIQGLSRVLLCSALFLVNATAENSREDWLEELTTAYAKHESLIVNYTATAKGKSLKVTLATDHPSDLKLLHIIEVDDGKTEEKRVWNTTDDHFYIQTPDDHARVDGMHEEKECFTEIGKAMWKIRGEQSPPVVQSYNFSILLDKESVEACVGFPLECKGSWKNALAAAVVDGSDEETVTFSTTDHGHLTFNRANGLLIRQSVKGVKGEDRALIAENVQLNPGKEAVLRLSSGWDTQAQPYPSYHFTKTKRSEFFQMMVNWVEEGHLTPEKLETYFEENHGLSERFANACYLDSPDSLSANKFWKMILDHQKSTLKKTWMEANPGPHEDEDKAFAVYLTDPKTRDVSRDYLLSQVVQIEECPEAALKETFIDQPRPQGKTDDGKAAAKIILDALTSSYLSVILDRKMTEFWGEAAGPR